MTPTEFKELTDVLGYAFTPLSDGQRDVLFEEFKNVPAAVFKKAVRLLLRDHPWAKFPIPKDIWRAVNVVAKNLPTAIDRKEAAKCPDCNGTGWRIVMKIEPIYPGQPHPVAQHCRCPLGRAMREAHRGQDAKEGRQESLQYPQQDEERSEVPDDWKGGDENDEKGGD